MATFATGNPQFNTAFTALAKAMLPDARTDLLLARAGAKSRKDAAEAAILEERAARASELGPEISAYLTSRAGIPENVAELPGISDVIAGPPTPATAALPADAVQRAEFFDALGPALAAREGNIEQYASGIGKTVGLSDIIAGTEEDALRKGALLYTGTAPSETTAITTGQVAANQAADLAEAESVARIKAAGDLAEGESVARIKAASDAGTASKAIKNYYVPDGQGGVQAAGRTRDGLTDMATGEPLPAHARVITGALPGDMPQRPSPQRLNVLQYETPDGSVGTTHDGGLTDAQTGEALPAQTRLYRPATPTGADEEVGLGNKTMAGIEDQLIAGDDVRALGHRLKNLVTDSPAVVGLLGSAAGHVKGLIGQVFDQLGGTETGQKVGTAAEWRARLGQLSQEVGLGQQEALFRSMMIDMAVQLARQAESGGRLSDQDVARQMQLLANVWSASSGQVLSALDRVMEESARRHQRNVRLYQGENLADVTSETLEPPPEEDTTDPDTGLPPGAVVHETLDEYMQNRQLGRQ